MILQLNPIVGNRKVINIHFHTNKKKKKIITNATTGFRMMLSHTVFSQACRTDGTAIQVF